jgi:hypothetical protein
MANEIKFYLSGGSSNTNPFLSLGGSISNTEIINGLLNNLWSDVPESDSNNGVIDHRVIFVKNVSGAPLADMRAYFGELDNFVGLAILSTTTANSAVALLATPTDAVTGYFEVWQNTAENPTSTVNLNNTYKRVVLYIANTKHAAYNQFPDQISIMMAKTGSPTGTATVKVWAMASGSAPSSTDNTVIRTLGTIDVAGLATTMTKKTFNTVTNVATNPLPSIGWRIGIEYTTGTATSHVDIAQTAQVATASAPSGAGSGTAATSQTWVMMALMRIDAASGFDTVNGQGVLLSHEIAEALSDPSVGVDYQDNENFVEQTAWADPNDPDTGQYGGEISDICTVNPPSDDQSYSDGLHVNCYWDNKGKKCVAAGATSPRSLNSGSSIPNVTNHGGVTPPSPQVLLIFWGTTWNSSNNTFRTNIINMVQNKLLGSDKQFWNIGMADYKFGMPVWSPSVVWNQDLPADPGGNGYTDTEVNTMFTNFLKSASIPSPLSSIYASQNVNVSNFCYCIMPDPTWKIEGGATADFGAYHSSFVYTATSTDPTPPPVVTPPGGGGGSGSSSPKGGYTQAWDGSKWVDFAANSPAFDIYTNFGACFQPGNPPPVGGGQPPPGECGATSPAAGAIPVAGGGGGAIQHGYNLTSATDNGNDGNQATGAIDRNLATRWSQSSTNALLTVDMGQNHPIDRLKIAWYKSSERQAKFKISYSTDNTVYTNIPPLGGGANFTSNGTTPDTGYQEFSLVQTSPSQAITARFIRYTGLGNTLNNWNSVTELEVYGPDVTDQPPGSPPPPTGINYSKPSSYDTGVPLPNLTNGDFVAIHLERAIPQGTQHSDIDNYSIVISNEPHPAPPPDEPIPPGGGGGGGGGGDGIPPIGEVPVPSPPGVFDPGVIPPPQEVPPPPPPGQCPGPPDQPPPPPDDGGGGGGGGGGTGMTPDGIKLVELPAGRTYGDQHTGFHENFQSNGSFRLDVGVQPQLNQLNLTFYLPTQRPKMVDATT